MNTELINGVIDSVKNFVAACGNDVVRNEEEEEYLVFNGQVSVDNKGNVKTYALDGDKKILMAQLPIRPILNNAADCAKAIVDLIDNIKKENDKKAEEEAQAEAERQEAENREVEGKINDLESEISSLRLRKKPVRFVKKLSFD
jgi:hypothetical protein